MRTLYFSTLVIAVALSACGRDSHSSDTVANQNHQVTDLSKMPLPKALQTKYSRLQFVCHERVTTIRPAGPQGTFSVAIDSSAVVWDILKNFSQTKTLDLADRFEDYQYSYKVRVQLRLYSGSFQPSAGSTLTYHFKNALVADFTNLDGKTWWYNKSGKLLSVETSHTGPDAVELFEGVSDDIANQSEISNGTGDGYKLKLQCYLAAKLKPEFTADTSCSDDGGSVPCPTPSF